MVDINIFAINLLCYLLSYNHSVYINWHSHRYVCEGKTIVYIVFMVSGIHPLLIASIQYVSGLEHIPHRYRGTTVLSEYLLNDWKGL